MKSPVLRSQSNTGEPRKLSLSPVTLQNIQHLGHILVLLNQILWGSNVWEYGFSTTECTLMYTKILKVPIRLKITITHIRHLRFTEKRHYPKATQKTSYRRHGSWPPRSINIISKDQLYLQRRDKTGKHTECSEVA